MMKDRTCSYCNAREGEMRPVGNFLVELKEVIINGVLKHACQSCKYKVKEVREVLNQ